MAENDEGNTWRRSKDSEDFLKGFNGAHLMQPFQCDLCWFRNLQKRDPVSSSYKDTMLLAHIRRVNLDIIWSRSKLTNYMSQYRKGIKVCQGLGLTPKHFPQGPWPIDDEVGFQVAIEVVGVSLMEGSTSKNHQQFDTIRAMRTMHQHMYESGPSKDNRVFKTTGESNKNVIVRTSHCPTDSLLFTRFALGCLSRMGREVKSDMALDSVILHLILSNLDNEWHNTGTSPQRKRWVSLVGCYLIVTFACSLRGNEGFMLDLYGLISHVNDGRNDDTTPHVVVPLLGRFKNEIGERMHLMLSVNITKSGFKVRMWIERWIKTLMNEDKVDGPAMCEEDGFLVESGKVNREFKEQLAIVQSLRPDLIKPNLDVFDLYNIRRSLRRGSSSIARRERVDQDIIDLVNRWSVRENSRGRSRGYSMRDYYTETRLVMHTILPYSAAL